MKFLKKLFSKTDANRPKMSGKNIREDLSQKEMKPKAHSVFLAGWELNLNGDDQCYDFIAAQITTENNVRSISSGIELVFKNNKLVEAFDFEDGEKIPKALKENELGLSYREFDIHPILAFQDNVNGLHQLGGDIPEGIIFPENDCQVPFQYLGFLSTDDPNFKWLPSTIHLMCPIFLNIDKVFLDYQNPKQPILLNRAEVESMDTAYEEDLNKNSKIIYQHRKFDLIPFDDFELPVHAGIPNWIQYPTFPKCPKSGKTMKFLCQINGGVPAKFSNVNPKKEFYRRYYEALNFWGDGDLFVFIEPVEKTVCYFIQNT